jgi:hypothetical protein
MGYSIDMFFFIDILVIFNSAFYDDEFQIVESRSVIMKSYLLSWFMIDLLAILPFEVILKGTTDNYQDIVRFARIGRMYKLIKMIRLIRVLKIVKQRSQLLKYLNDFLKIGLGFERLFFFAMIFLLLSHILTCIWVITA